MWSHLEFLKFERTMSLAPKKCIHRQWYHFDCHMCAYQNEQPLSLHVSFCSQGIEATSLNLTCQSILNHLSGLPILSVAVIWGVRFQTSIIFLRMPRCGSCGKSWSQWRSLSLTSCSGMEGRGCCSWWSSVRVSVGCRRSPLICDFPRFELPQAGITDHLIGGGTNTAQKYVHLDLARGLYNILMILKHILHNHSGSIWPMRRRSRPGGSSMLQKWGGGREWHRDSPIWGCWRSSWWVIQFPSQEEDAGRVHKERWWRWVFLLPFMVLLRQSSVSAGFYKGVLEPGSIKLTTPNAVTRRK